MTEADGRQGAVDASTRDVAARTESGTPLLAPPRPEGTNVTDLLLERAAASPERPVYALREGTSRRRITAAEFLADVRWLAKGLVAGGLGVGDRVAILAPSSYEWTLADFAVWYAGGATVPVYETDSPAQIEWILRDSGARRVFAAPGLVPMVSGVIEGSAELAERFIQITSLALDGEGATLSSLAGPGQGVSDAELERHRVAAGLRTPATIVYTSGTTGRPKGCVITHANFVDLADNLIPHLPVPLASPDARTVMFLPLAHVLAHAVQVVCLAAGVTVAYSSPNDLLSTLRSFRPTFLLGVPRIFEKVYAGAREQAVRSGRSGVFTRAAAVAREYSASLDDAAAGRGEGPSRGLRLKHAVFDRLVYARLRSVFGGALETTVSGGGALSPQLAHFFRGVGVPVLEGYGLTETTGPCTVNTVDAVRVGTVGRPIPGTSVKIADDGEVLVRGIGVFAGYHGSSDEGNEAHSDDQADGVYFPTGDLGRLDEDGFLTIIGRKKDVLVTAGGKNVAPEPLEETVRESSLVEHAVVVGEGRPFVAALIVLDRDGLASWCRERGRTLDADAAATDPEVLDELQAAVDSANALVSRAESIRKFAVVGISPSIEGGNLTPSLKLKRDAILAECHDEVEALYS
ncbi:AMP-dependent synthetase/ligase [Sinomonas susongensis]|uniref:AMP-dependent synthetase/ligase n=1 Tax=Sinomonas susongensis TaxID=1324851 RepID=UPI00110816E4|nr:AMP-dependent synthetase/ligase [Sinomonas susongensis]